MKYKSVIELKHVDGETVTIEITGPSPEKVAHVSNTIKTRYAMSTEGPGIVSRCDTIERERLWYDFLRDFFHTRKRS